MNRNLRHSTAATVLSFLMTLVGSSAAAQEAAPRPDLLVRLLEVKDKHLVTVYVLNRGNADALGSFVELSVGDAAAKTGGWIKRFAFDPVARGVTSKMEYDLSPLVVEAGMLVRATIDSSERIPEQDETNNMRELIVPAAVAAPAPAPAPKPAPIKIAPSAPPASGPAKNGPSSAPAPSGPPKISPPPPPIPIDVSDLALLRKKDPPPSEDPLLPPDLAPIGIQLGATLVTGTLKNVGHRAFHALDAKIKDSFKRTLSLKRVALVGTENVTQDLGARPVGDLAVGKTFNYGFPVPKSVPGATQYTWILTLDGQDQNVTNNTFTKVTKVTKID